MSTYEGTPWADPDAYLQTVLNSRQPLPVGFADLSQFVDPDAVDISDQEPGYTWERPVRWIEEMDEIFNHITGPFLGVNIGASIPTSDELLEGRGFKRADERARELVAPMFREKPGDELGDPIFNQVNQFAARKVTRAMLTAAVQKVLFTKNMEDEADGSKEGASRRMRFRLYDVLVSQDVHYMIETEGSEIDVMWQTRFNEEKELLNYFEMLAAIPCQTAASKEAGQRITQYPKGQPVPPEEIAIAREREPLGPERANRYIDWQVRQVADVIANNDRFEIARFISMDIARPDDIARSSMVKTPETTRNTALFSRAVARLYDSNRHIVGDMFKPLPIPDGSAAFITCYDAWQLRDDDFKKLSAEEIEISKMVAIETIFGWYKKLKNFGKIVIFDWGNKSQPEIISDITFQLSLLMGHTAYRAAFHHATLEELMSESDLTTAKHLSGIFKDNPVGVEALVIKKPKQALVDRHAKAFGKRMLIAANAAQLRAQTNPTP